MPSEDSDRVDGLWIEPHFRSRHNDHNATVTERVRSLRRALFGTFECKALCQALEAMVDGARIARAGVAPR